MRLLASPDDLRVAEREAVTAQGVVVMDATDWQVGACGGGWLGGVQRSNILAAVVGWLLSRLAPSCAARSVHPTLHAAPLQRPSPKQPSFIQLARSSQRKTW